MMGIYMIELFYKSLIISLISAQLSFGSLSAYSAEVENTKATASMSKTDNSGLTRDSNGVLKKTETHSFSGTGESDALSSVTMLAIGVIGMRLLTYQKRTLDMTIVVAASAAYIAAEIANVMSLKKQLKDMEIKVTKSSDGKNDQAQIETLEKLKESYEKVKKSSQTRKMLQLTAAAVYGGALAIAAYQRLTEEGQMASCLAASAEAKTELATCAASTSLAASESASCALCGAMVADTETGITQGDMENQDLPRASQDKVIAAHTIDGKTDLSIKTPCAGAAASAIKGKTLVGACTTYLVTKKTNESWGTVVKASASTNKPIIELERLMYAGIPSLPKNTPNKSIDPLLSIKINFEKGMEFLFPKAEAGMTAFLGLGVGAAAAFWGAQTKMGQAIDGYIFTPGGRIIIWGILAGAALMAAKSTQSEIDKIDGHLQKIAQILKDMNTLKSGIKSNNVNEQQIKYASISPGQDQMLQLNSDTNVKTDCLASAGNSNCTALSDTIRSMPGFSELPESLKSITSQSAKLGDGLSGTNAISGATLSAAEALANKQGAIAKLGNSIKNKINEKLLKSGKQKIDFDKQEKGLWGVMKAQTGNALKASGMTGGAFLSSTGIAPISSALTASNTPLKMSPPRGAPNSSQSEKNKNKEGEFMLDLSDNSSDLTTGTGGLEAAGSFDIGSNDINTNSEASIFQVISNRYIRSAYPKLLEEIPIKN